MEQNDRKAGIGQEEESQEKVAECRTMSVQSVHALEQGETRVPD
jgi:hypothetical protein